MTIWLRSGLTRFRHLAGLVSLLATNGTFTQLVFQHRVVGGATAPEFLPGDNVTNVDHHERKEEHTEDDG